MAGEESATEGTNDVKPGAAPKMSPMDALLSKASSAAADSQVAAARALLATEASVAMTKAAVAARDEIRQVGAEVDSLDRSLDDARMKIDGVTERLNYTVGRLDAVVSRNGLVVLGVIAFCANLLAVILAYALFLFIGSVLDSDPLALGIAGSVLAAVLIAVLVAAVKRLRHVFEPFDSKAKRGERAS